MKNLTHIDERLGRVAIDMGLMDQEQVKETIARVSVMRGGIDPSITFGKAALELGYLKQSDLEHIEAEEHRRRRLINGYEIIDNLGSGTIASVYRARQLAMDRDVALKILHPRLATDPVFIQVYIEEAQAVSRFHHPHIVQGFDSGESNGFYYFAHEYLSGGSMADRLRSMGETGERFSENQLLIYLRQTTSALKHAWSVAVYHGDLNPGNLLLDGQGDIKLANLGVPRVAKPRKGMASNARTSLRFVRCGPEYAAPEQLDAPELVNARTDMYSLGATFYHLSFGVPPFSGKDRGDILEFRRKNPVPQFSLKSQEGFSGKYLRLIHDMLEVDPEKRPADPEELADRLENFHIADVDELSGLARQVRDVAGPIGVASSARQATPRVRAPVDGAGMRNYSLAPRSKYMKMGRGGYWAIAAAVAIAVISIVAFFL